MKNNQESLINNNSEKIKQDSYELSNQTSFEKKPEKLLSQNDLENQADKAKQEALDAAISVEKKSKDSEKIIKNTPKTSSRGPISRKQTNDSYKKTMKQVQKELPLSNKLFSKITHNPFIEKTSDIIGTTIAKPNAMLSGAVMAFILTLLTYTVARKIGYELSGFETIGSFIVGWIVGVVYDYIKVLITGKK